jgi:transcriptional regulator with XRE-family HTH domain
MIQETNYLERLGAKLSELRKKKGMTQEDVATKIGMQRPSYTLVEMGKRHVATQELYNLSSVLDFSIPEILSEIFDSPKMNDFSSVVYQKKRMFNYQKFKTVLLYILDQCRDKQNIGKVVLNKLLYYSDFNYYFKHKEYLTGLRYSKLPKGPVPGIEAFIEQMKNNVELKEIPVNYYGYPSVRYVPMVKPDYNYLTVEERYVIDEVIAVYADMNAAEISDLSHDDPPWLETPNIGDEIDYDLVFKRKTSI